MDNTLIELDDVNLSTFQHEDSDASAGLLDLPPDTVCLILEELDPLRLRMWAG